MLNRLFFFTKHNRIQNALLKDKIDFLSLQSMDDILSPLEKLKNVVFVHHKFARYCSRAIYSNKKETLAVANLLSFEENLHNAENLFFPSLKFLKILPGDNRSNESFYWEIDRIDVEAILSSNVFNRFHSFVETELEPAYRYIKNHPNDGTLNTFLIQHQEMFNTITSSLIDSIQNRHFDSESFLSIEELLVNFIALIEKRKEQNSTHLNLSLASQTDKIQKKLAFEKEVQTKMSSYTFDKHFLELKKNLKQKQLP